MIIREQRFAHQIHVRVDESVWKQLDDLAKRYSVSKSLILRLILLPQTYRDLASGEVEELRVPTPLPRAKEERQVKIHVMVSTTEEQYEIALRFATHMRLSMSEFIAQRILELASQEKEQLNLSTLSQLTDDLIQSEAQRILTEFKSAQA